MTKLWQKGYRLNEQVERFEGAQNSALDNKLIRHDVWGSLAHAAMLKHIGILKDNEYQTLKDALCNILKLEKAATFTVSPADEDVHTSVENHHVADKLCQLCAALLDFADAHADVPMPGYTHMQRAMLSSVGLWAASFSEALLDDEKLLSTAYDLNDQSPLGSAAGYGVPLAINRQYSSDLLGFSRVQQNVIYVQNSRGKIEAAIVQALAQIMLDLSKLAQDILLFTTVEYGFFQVAQELCTGSSIMPQMRNLGVMELVRARTQTMLALQQQILGIVSGLPSGYNMDYQETKRPFMEALNLVQESLEICTLVVNSLEVNTDRLIAACTFELFAADRAYELTTTANLPFRDAYRIVGAEVTAQLDRKMPLPVESQEQLIKRLSARSHLGGAGNLGLAIIQNQLEHVNSLWEERAETFTKTIEALTGAASEEI